MPGPPSIRSMVSRRVAEFRLAVMLLTRLPAGTLTADAPPMSAAVWAYPLVGAVAAVPPAIVFTIAAEGLPVVMAALLAIITGLLVTGALHEDGLADVCDGLAGGTREQRLEIMRDSRIGTYGALGLILSIALRVTALASVADTTTGAIALIAFGAASRAGLPFIMRLQQPARTDGLGASVGLPATGPTIVACGLGISALMLSGAGLLGAFAVAISLTFASWYCDRKIGGYTGDTLGASQQIAEVACWLTLLSRS